MEKNSFRHKFISIATHPTHVATEQVYAVMSFDNNNNT